jgi:alkanesulfonate monooxygenase SsuD/methylene tetrahydromethanopterin reductase-like flavin-dependent oxidoreductase (luciferase family)
MTCTVFVRSEAEVRRKLADREESAAALRERGMIVGTGEEFVEQIKAFEAAGAYRIMLQWLDLDDLEGLEAMAQAVLPQLQ